MCASKASTVDAAGRAPFSLIARFSDPVRPDRLRQQVGYGSNYREADRPEFEPDVSRALFVADRRQRVDQLRARAADHKQFLGR
jgi:hypothetical protein